MKKYLIILLLSVGFFSQLQAQEADKFRFDLRWGYVVANGGGSGVLFNLEPKWTIKDNMNVGLRLGIGVYARIEEGNDLTDAEVGINASWAATYDYYFHNGSSSFAPFVGGGLGYYQVANIEIDDSDFNDNSNETVEIGGNGKLGLLLRGGFDLGKFRLAAEYNFIGKSDLVDFNDDIIGTSKNGYFGISIGFYFGGGKWGK